MLWLLDEDEKRKQKCKELFIITLRLLEIFPWEERIRYNSGMFSPS